MRCEHNDKVTHFCLTESCTWKQAAGCENCMKKYHNHIGKTNIINEKDLNQNLQKFTMGTQVKAKCRVLQQAIYDYLTFIKTQFGSAMDSLSRNLINRLGSPAIYKHGHLNIYKKIKSNDYRKLIGKDLSNLIKYVSNQQKSQIQVEQKRLYHQQASKSYQVMQKINDLMKQFGELLKEYDTQVESNNAFFAKISSINQQRKLQSPQQHEEKSNNQSKPQNIIKPFIVEQSQKFQSMKTNLTNQQKIQNKKQQKIRKISLDYQFETFKVPLTLSKYDEQQKQILQRKKKLIEIIGKNTNTKKQATNQRKSIMEHLEIPKSKQAKPKNCSIAKRNESIESGGSENNNIIHYFGQNSNGADGILENQPFMKTSLPAAKEKKPLYQDKQDVNKKTITVPMKNLVEEQEPSSPLLKKRRTSTQAKEFSLGLKKVIQKQEIQERTPIQEKDQKEQQPMKTNEQNSLALLLKALPMKSIQAIPLLEKAIQQSNNNLSAAQYLSYLYLESHQAKKCLDLCNDFLSKIEHSPIYDQLSIHLSNNKAAALNLLGRYSESIPILQRCLTFSQKDVFYKNIADSYFFLGIIQKSMIYYQKAINLNHSFDEALYNMAVCFYIQKNYQQSKNMIMRAIEACPNNSCYLELYKNIDKIICSMA